MTGSLLWKFLSATPENDPAILLPNFETESLAVTYDMHRITSLERALKNSNLWFYHEKIENLIRRLELVTNDDLADFLNEIESRSLASKVLARDVRRGVSGAIFSYLQSHPYEEIGAVTLIDCKHIVKTRRLVNLDLSEWTRETKRQVYQRLPSGWKGSLFAFWEGEYEPNREQWQFHLHMIATDDVLAAVRQYAADITPTIIANSDTVKKPCHYDDMAGKSDRELLSWITYMLKLDPKARLISMPDIEGKTKRAGRPHHMSDAVKACYWLFLDSKTIRDLIILIGVKPGKNGFISTRL